MTTRDLPKTAPQWIARLEADGCTASDRDAFERWRTSSEENRAAITRYHRLGLLSRELASNAEAWADLVAEVDSSPRIDSGDRRRRPWKLALAAGLACCMIVTGALYFSRDDAPANSVTASPIEPRTLTLEDGSVVTLNLKGEIQPSFTANERRVLMPVGEAFFVVTKDPTRPFIVSTGASEVRVTGTEFSVRRDGRIVEVIVRRGSVEVLPDASARPSAADTRPVAIALDAGKRLQFEPRPGRLEIAAVDAERLTTWRKGSVEFDAATLEEVLAEMNRHFYKPVVIDDDVLAGLKVSGRFRVGDAESLALSIAERFDLRVIRSETDTHLRKP